MTSIENGVFWCLNAVLIYMFARGAAWCVLRHERIEKRKPCLRCGTALDECRDRAGGSPCCDKCAHP